MSLAFPIEINILDFIFKGIIIGVIASAPMGPVGILCIQRTLNKGRWFGFVTGIGAACSDIVYALFTGLGMSFVMDFVNVLKIYKGKAKFLVSTLDGSSAAVLGASAVGWDL
jgi:hypothetical protein